MLSVRMFDQQRLRNFTKLHLSRDADFSIENYYAKQERVTRTGIVIFTRVCHIIIFLPVFLPAPTGFR